MYDKFINQSNIKFIVKLISELINKLINKLINELINKLINRLINKLINIFIINWQNKLTNIISKIIVVLRLSIIFKIKNSNYSYDMI